MLTLVALPPTPDGERPPLISPEHHTADLDAPVAVVTTNPDGDVVVVADRTLPPRKVEHLHDYADRLAEMLIPGPRIG